MALIDVHTHMLSHAYAELLERHGAPRLSIGKDREGSTIVLRKGARFMTFTPPMFDPLLRLEAMDAAGVDMGLLSFTCPNAYWARGGWPSESCA